RERPGASLQGQLQRCCPRQERCAEHPAAAGRHHPDPLVDATTFGLLVPMTWLALMVATPALSQGTAAPRSSGGLFGATRSDVGGRDRLNVLFDMSEALDSELPPEFRSRVP